MNYFDYYYAAIFANHLGFNISLLEINNQERPGIIHLVAAKTSQIVSNNLIIETLDELIDRPGKLRYGLRDSNFAGVIQNENKILRAALKEHSDRMYIYSSPDSKDIKQSLYNIATKLGDGKLRVDPSLEKEIKFDLSRTTETEINARINALILVCDNWTIFKHKGMPIPQPQRIYGVPGIG